MDGRIETADEKTKLVRRQLRVLDEILTSSLSRPPLSFDRLLAASAEGRFEPGTLAVPGPAPAWEDYRPARRRRGRRATAARVLFETAQAEYVHNETYRRNALARAKARHDRDVTAERVRAARHNADIARWRAAFADRDPRAVEWFTGQVLAASRYPDVFPRDHRVAYHPGTRTVRAALALPPSKIVPAARAFRYVSSRAAAEPVPRPDAEIRQRYRRLIAAIALRTLHEVFAATPPEVVAAVTVTGTLTSADPATGRSVRPCLVRVDATREVFGQLVLGAVDPVACLAHLDGALSPDPVRAEPAE